MERSPDAQAPIPHWMQLQIDRNHPQKSSNHVDVVPQLSDCEVDIRSQNASVFHVFTIFAASRNIKTKHATGRFIYTARTVFSWTLLLQGPSCNVRGPPRRAVAVLTAGLAVTLICLSIRGQWIFMRLWYIVI